MKTQRIYGKLILPLMVSAALLGCRKEGPSSGDAPTVDMTLRLDTYAVGDDPHASSANEERVKSAWVYIFNEHGVLENRGKTSVPLTPAGEATDASERLNRTWNVTLGRKDIYVVLNAGNILLNGSPVALASYNPRTKAEVESLVTDPAHFAADFTASGSAGMLMSGTLSPTVTKTTSSVTVPVMRRYARIDVRLSRAAELAGTDISVDKVSYRSRRETALIIAPSTESTGADLLFAPTLGSITLGPTGYTDIISFYTMPRTGAAKAACLELTVSIDGREDVRPLFINSGAIGGGNANDEDLPLDIAANTIYRVDATLSRKDMGLELDILGWHGQPVEGNINGTRLIVKTTALAPGAETHIPVATDAKWVRAKLSDVAVAAGYSLRGADAATGVLTLAVTDGTTAIPVTAPVTPVSGPDYTLTVTAGNIRRTIELKLK